MFYLPAAGAYPPTSPGVNESVRDFAGEDAGPWPWVGLLCATATAAYLCRVNVSVAGALLMDELHLSQAQMGRVFSAFLLGYALFMVPAECSPTAGGRDGSSSWSRGGGSRPRRCRCSSARPAHRERRRDAGVAPGAPLRPGRRPGADLPRRGPGRGELGRSGQPGSRERVRDRGHRARVGDRAAARLGSDGALGLAGGARVSTLPALATALVCASWESRSPRPPSLPVPRRVETAAPLRSRSFVLLTLSYSLQGYVGYIFVFWFYLYLVQERHFDLLKGAVLSSLPWLLSIVSIPLGGWISDRIAARHGPRRRPPRGAPRRPRAGGVFLSLGARTTNGYVAAVSLALSTALVLCVEGPFWATMTEIAGGRSGLAGGIMNTGSNVGGLVSPALTPVLAAAIGWENALHVAAALSVVAAFLWLGIDPRPPGTVSRS